MMKKTIKKEIIVNAKPLIVWETLTTKQGLEKFFVKTAENDLEEGKTTRLYVDSNFSYQVNVEKVIPFKKLRWVDRLIETDEAIVEWSIESTDNIQTKITMVSSGFGNFNEGVEWGWETSMRVLKWVVEEGYNRQTTAYLGCHGGLIGMGFKIYKVEKNSPADLAGLRSGDRIQGIGNHTLCGVSWVQDILHHYPTHNQIELRVVREGDWVPEKIQIKPVETYLEMGEYDLI